ncbi:MAG: aldehyde dehydrogenase (NADP(+)) [Candidatus Eisenbacteria bacterium]
METTGLSLIDGAPSAGEPRRFVAHDPARGAAIDPEFFTASAGEVDRAARLAADAFRTFGRTTGAERALFLRTLAEEIEMIRPDLIERAPLETGLPAGRIEAETGRTVSQLRLFADFVEEGSWVDARIDHADPGRAPVPKPDVRSMHRPVGPVAVFCASNFPIAFSVAGGDTASALAGGNPVVVVAHHAHPGTAEIVGWAVIRALRACRLPLGTFALLQGRGEDVGVPLVRHPAIRAVGFTGSRGGGLALARVAAERDVPIPVFAEMSSVNPVFVLPEALETRGDAIAAGLHASVTLGVGQFCTNPGFVHVPAGAAADGFAGALARAGEGTVTAPMLTEAIRKTYRAGVERWDSCATRVSSTADPDGPGGQGAGFSVFRVRGADLLAGRVSRDEVFGPCTVLVEYESREELIALAESWEGQLTATVHGVEGEVSAYPDLVDALERCAGRVLFGGFPTGVEVCHAMVHGGPFPSTSDGRSTSVGTRAILRFVRPVCWQNAPTELLPAELEESNPLGIRRLVDGTEVGRTS